MKGFLHVLHLQDTWDRVFRSRWGSSRWDLKNLGPKAAVVDFSELFIVFKASTVRFCEYFNDRGDRLHFQSIAMGHLGVRLSRFVPFEDWSSSSLSTLFWCCCKSNVGQDPDWLLDLYRFVYFYIYIYRYNHILYSVFSKHCFVSISCDDWLLLPECLSRWIEACGTWKQGPSNEGATLYELYAD